MDEDDTTPKPNPSDDDKDKYGKTHYQGNMHIHDDYSKHQHDGWYGKKPIPPSKKEQPSVYDEIAEDLIDIIAKLLKELSKRK
jgi:hypothetical protein